MPAGVAAGHPATAEVGLRILNAGGTAADAAVAAMLASCVAESIFTGLAGGGFCTYFDATTNTVTCLDFFCVVPGLDGDLRPGPMVPIDVIYGIVPQNYMIGGASVAVPGIPAGAAEVHRRWGRLPWRSIVEPAVRLAAHGVTVPTAQGQALAAVAPALIPGDGAGIYAPGGSLLSGGDVLYHPGLDKALSTLAEDGPSTFYTGWIGELTVRSVRETGGALGLLDLESYRVRERPAVWSDFAGRRVAGRHDLNQTIATIRALPGDLSALRGPQRAVALARALLRAHPARYPNTTNVSVVDGSGSACVITLTLGIGSGVWLPGLGVNLNSMLGEGELKASRCPPGDRLPSMMCPLVVIDADGGLALAAGSAGASRIRTALIATLVGVLIDGRDPAEAIGAARFHPVQDERPGTAPVIHAEPDYPEDELSALAEAGFAINRWDHMSHYFGGVSAVGAAGAAGDPRRGGVGMLC